MLLTNCLVFDGNCREAFETYARILGGEITAMMSNADMPPEARNAWAAERPDKIVHAWLQIGDQALMGSDCPPEYLEPVGGFSVGFHTDDPAEARRVFEALTEGGTIKMPFGPTFWSPGFGMATDRFGTPWMINTNPKTAAA
jgi:PhnB protein